MKPEQLALFALEEAPAEPQPMPAGFRYAPDFIDAAKEARLAEAFADLPFKEFEFHGFLGKRRVVSFGTRYDFNDGSLKKAEPMPAFLLPLRERAAAFAGLAPDDLAHALVTEYRPGTTIGWHRDRPHYGDVVGVSLVSPCTCRLRKRRGGGFERASLRLAPRSVYLLRGPSREEWEHSIPAVDALRYSVTFRSSGRETHRQTSQDCMMGFVSLNPSYGYGLKPALRLLAAIDASVWAPFPLLIQKAL